MHIYKDLDKAYKGVKIILVDACRDDPTSGRRSRGVDADSAPRPPSGVAALFSCSAGERAFELEELKHGVFFHYVLEGLRGEARDRDKEVTFEGLSAYVRKQVARQVPRLIKQGAQQSPNMKADLSGETLVLLGPPKGDVPSTDVKVDLPDEITNDIGMTFKLVRPGKFLTGSPKDEKKRNLYEAEFDAEEQHEVEITRPFYIGVTEVTQEQYEAVMKTNPSHFTEKNGGGPNHPVEMVSWEDTQDFLKKLSDLPKERAKKHLYRLPTEAEWEYSCRGGPGAKDTAAPFYFDKPTFALDSSLANFDGDCPYGGAEKGVYRGKTTPVGQFKANPLGLKDMHGNVWEWCQDYYGPYNALKTNKDPLQDKSQDNDNRRVARGGSWNDAGRGCRAAFRLWYVPGNRYYSFGFRAVLVVP